jgi:ubiquinone/menaquinone biosynthesis C-methylase UbiE
VDLAEYRQRSYDIWEAMAEGWDRRRQWLWEVSRPVGESLVRRLDPQPGQQILELAAGPGETGFVVASQLGDGKLIQTDFSPEMVESAKRGIAERGLENVEARVMDAENMDLDDDSVDGVLCRWGYMLMADPAAALSETRRVMRDGGRLSFSVWAEGERNPWAAMSGMTFAQQGHVPAPQPGDPGMFAMGPDERINELVSGAGFGSIDIEEVNLEWRFDDFQQYWEFLGELAGAIALVMKTLSDRELDQARDALQKAIEPYRSNGGYAFPGVAKNVLAT